MLHSFKPVFMVRGRRAAFYARSSYKLPLLPKNNFFSVISTEIHLCGVKSYIYKVINIFNDTSVLSFQLYL